MKQLSVFANTEMDVETDQAAGSAGLPPGLREADAAPPKAVRAPGAQPATDVAPTPVVETQVRRGVRYGVIGLIIVDILIGLVVLSLFGVRLQRVPGGDTNEATPSPGMVVQEFQATQLEVIVRPGIDETGLRNAFGDAFAAAVTAQFGPGAQVRRETLTYGAGQPQPVGKDPRGIKYQGAMRGQILVPKP